MYLYIFLFFAVSHAAPPFSSIPEIKNAFQNNFNSYWIYGSNTLDPPGSLSKYSERADIPSRIGAAAWDVENMLISYGGTDAVHNSFNDMYKSTDYGVSWYWIYGSNEAGFSGSYPAQYGLISVPRSRYYCSYWHIGNFLYIFGGRYQWFPSTQFNADLHKVSIDSIKDNSPVFYWIAGSNTLNYLGSYISYDVPGSIPRNRGAGQSWLKDDNTVFFYGGFTSGNNEYLTDVMYFHLNDSKFTWISGCDTTSDAAAYSGSYPSTYNQTGVPPSRAWSLTWYYNDIVYLFGGFTDNTMSKTYNDLWVSYNDGRVWYWMNGCDQANNQGIYYSPDQNDYPASRSALSSFTLKVSANGVFHSYAIFYGGFFQGSIDHRISDWWLLDFDTFNFTLLRGDNTTDANAVYPSSYNQVGTIGAIEGHNMVFFKDFIYLLFGVGNIDSPTEVGYLNSIWRISFYAVFDENQSSFTLTPTQFVFISLFSMFFIVCLVFSIFKNSLLYSFEIEHDKYYLYFVFIGILNFIGDVLFILFLLFFTQIDNHLYIFFISLFLFILSIVVNFSRIGAWKRSFLQSDNTSRKMVNDFFDTNKLFFFMVSLFHPSLLYFFKLSHNSITTFLPNVTQLCLFFDFYSLLPQSIILYYVALSSSLEDYSILFYIILLFKFNSQLTMLLRIVFILFIGGGKSPIKKHSLKYGVFKTVRDQKPQPGLVSASTLSVIEISDNSSSHSSVFDSVESIESSHNSE